MVPTRRRCRGEVGQPAHLQQTKRQRDAIPGNPGVEPLLGNAVFRPIALDPELAVSDVNVHQATMGPADPLGAYSGKL